MSDSSIDEKLKLIYQLLFDLAHGKSPLVYKTFHTHDAFDSLLEELLQTGTRLRELIIKHDALPPKFRFQTQNPLLFVLDSTYTILDFNTSVPEQLLYSPELLKDKKLTALLDTESVVKWELFKMQFKPGTFLAFDSPLYLCTSKGNKIPFYCSMTSWVYHQTFVLVSVQICMDSITETRNSKTLTDQQKMDLQVVVQIHDYILEHLDEPLPTLKTFVALFGSEEHRVRTLFRKKYNTSVYQFYQDERLQKAFHLIVFTQTPLKEIAFDCGFGMYLNFYKAFRKKFGISPSELSRGDNG
ncbi:AraC family transcriptional regulator [Flavobacterium sp.]|uniref:AraC family transcriptional regulator n=1 Tax=Flavobacterium sp. TaxID=239 RepID=UPI002FDB319D